MVAQALDQLVQAIEAGLKLNPELLDQSDSTKSAYWREILCPALQIAKEAKADALRLRELALIMKIVGKAYEMGRMSQMLKREIDLPAEFLEPYTEDMHDMKPLLEHIGKLVDNAAVETLVS